MGTKAYSRPITLALLVTFAVAMTAAQTQAETGREGWLRYARIGQTGTASFQHERIKVYGPGESEVMRTARRELVHGLKEMLGPNWVHSGIVPGKFLLGSLQQMQWFHPPLGIEAEGFWLSLRKCEGQACVVIVGGSDRGVLYGVFEVLSKLARVENVRGLEETQNPANPIRWAEEWDNLDGSVERGYAGRSIFFDAGEVRRDLTRVSEYARLLASVGINGCNINNVNANPRTLQRDFLPQIARIADAMRPWGVRIGMSVDVSSPKTIGGLETFDPLDPKVAAWWQSKTDEIYKLIPDFAGFVVKADSEGRVGPSAYGRTPADAANVIARALKPHGGVILYRAFVYNHHLNWRDPKADRARAAYDIFHPLDGMFDDNVVVQIKYGPIDFQAREPVSPLLGGLEKTNEAIELQVTQEYTGQQRHLVYLAPMWTEVLNFDLSRADRRLDPREAECRFASEWCVKNLVAGKTFHRPLGGMVAVVNVGLDENWLAHPFAMANLYAFGRLAWSPELDAQRIFEEWSQLTFGNDPAILKVATRIAMASWRAYEDYTGPLGTQTLTDILGSHYGPGIESSEENGWGQWHRADHLGIGMDRSVASGTGFAGQYRPQLAQGYESLETTPIELLLFFHHVPYTYKRPYGKTVIQQIYDSHYQGANEVAMFVRDWRALKGKVDEQRYNEVLAKLEYQAGHAIVWRDAICNYFLKLSGIADEKGRAGHFPDRVEAETMQLRGYVPVEVTPWENASGGRAIECHDEHGCSVSFKFAKVAGRYEIDVEYFDQNNGESKFRLYLNGLLLDEWAGTANLPATNIGGDSSTRRRVHGVVLKPGDEIRIDGVPDGKEPAALDYLEIFSEPQ